MTLVALSRNWPKGHPLQAQVALVRGRGQGAGEELPIANCGLGLIFPDSNGFCG